jgi:hypothetical protein
MFINELAEVTQEIYVDWQLIDTKLINKNNITTVNAGVGTWQMWTEYVWWPWQLIAQYQEVVCLRTKWNLQKKGRLFKIKWRCNSLWANLRLEQIDTRFVVLPFENTNLTK